MRSQASYNRVFIPIAVGILALCSRAQDGPVVEGDAPTPAQEARIKQSLGDLGALLQYSPNEFVRSVLVRASLARYRIKDLEPDGAETQADKKMPLAPDIPGTVSVFTEDPGNTVAIDPVTVATANLVVLGATLAGETAHQDARYTENSNGTPTDDPDPNLPGSPQPHQNMTQNRAAKRASEWEAGVTAWFVMTWYNSRIETLTGLPVPAKLRRFRGIFQDWANKHRPE
jgi:hypothetical protein